MNIGDLLKQYRLKLGITQKQMAADILSPSYYSKVERGEHKIAAEDLLKILRNHSIDSSEFISVIYQNESDQSGTFQYLNSKINLYYYQGNFDKLVEIPNQIKGNKSLSSFESQLLLSLNEVVLYKITREEEYLTEKNKSFLKNQFFEAENWNSFKLSLYTNIMDTYDNQSNKTIVSWLLNRNIEDYSAEDQPIVLYILVNFINECLLNESLLLARRYNNLILNTPANYNNILQKIFAKYYEYIIMFIEKPNLENENKALEIVEIFRIIDFGIYEKAIELLEKTKKLYL